MPTKAAKTWLSVLGCLCMAATIAGIVIVATLPSFVSECPATYSGYYCVTLNCRDVEGRVHPCDCDPWCYTPPTKPNGRCSFLLSSISPSLRAHPLLVASPVSCSRSSPLLLSISRPSFSDLIPRHCRPRHRLGLLLLPLHRLGHALRST